MGKITTYSYNADTNMLEWVKYPNDTDATRTNYTYDSMYRSTDVVLTQSQFTMEDIHVVEVQ